MSRKQTVTERDQKILKMWGEGLTGLQIGEVLGVTRNAILGRLHRLKAYGIDTAKLKPAKTVEKKSCPAPKTRAQLALRVAPTDQKKSKTIRVYYPPRPEPQPGDGVSLLGLKSSSCRYIISSESSHAVIFCGEDKERGSYCAHHAQICYVPTPAKKAKKSNEFTIYKYGRLPEAT